MQTISNVVDDNNVQTTTYNPHNVWEPIVSAEVIIEPGKVYVTSEYNAFKNYESNREIDEEKVIRLVASMQDGNTPILAPSLVNEDLFLIDGQHRHEAYKRAKKPFAFIMQPGLNETDIPLYNNNLKNWTSEDYLKSYADKGYPHYVALQSYMQLHDVSQSTAMRFLTGQKNISRNIMNNKERSFENGEFQINTTFDTNGTKIVNFKSVIAELTLVDAENAEKFISRESFVMALMHVISHKDYVHNKMIKGIIASHQSESQMKQFDAMAATHLKRKQTEYIKFLQSLYNFGKHSDTDFSN